MCTDLIFIGGVLLDLLFILDFFSPLALNAWMKGKVGFFSFLYHLLKEIFLESLDRLWKRYLHIPTFAFQWMIYNESSTSVGALKLTRDSYESCHKLL
jgi:hypothetical protein